MLVTRRSWLFVDLQVKRVFDLLRDPAEIGVGHLTTTPAPLGRRIYCRSRLDLVQAGVGSARLSGRMFFDGMLGALMRHGHSALVRGAVTSAFIDVLSKPTARSLRVDSASLQNADEHDSAVSHVRALLSAARPVTTQLSSPALASSLLFGCFSIGLGEFILRPSVLPLSEDYVRLAAISAVADPMPSVYFLLRRLELTYRLRIKGIDRKRRKRNPSLRYVLSAERVPVRSRLYSILRLIKLGLILYPSATFRLKLAALFGDLLGGVPTSPIWRLRFQQQTKALGQLLFYRSKR